MNEEFKLILNIILAGIIAFIILNLSIHVLSTRPLDNACKDVGFFEHYSNDQCIDKEGNRYYVQFNKSIFTAEAKPITVGWVVIMTIMSIHLYKRKKR